MTDKTKMATLGRVAITTKFVSVTLRNRLFQFYSRSHFKYCVAIAMCLIVALLFSLSYRSMLVALLYNTLSTCSVKNYTSGELDKLDNRKCIFSNDGI